MLHLCVVHIRQPHHVIVLYVPHYYLTVHIYNVLLFLQETTSEDEPTSEDEEETSEDVSCCITCDVCN